MQLTESLIKELLVDHGFIDEKDFKRAANHARASSRPLNDILIDEGLVKDEELGQLIAQHFGYHFVYLQKEAIDEEVMKKIPEIMARQQGVIAFKRDRDAVSIGMIDPVDAALLHILEKRFACPVNPYYITENDHKLAMAKYQGDWQEKLTRMIAAFNQADDNNERHNQLAVDIIDHLLAYGQYSRASDIHIEPLAEETVVRFRIDGLMHEVLRMPQALAELFTMRIKILSRMKTDEYRAAQDGKFQFKAGTQTVDARVSVIPVTNGENVVMRLLASDNRQINLNELGFSEADFTRLTEHIRHPHDMILVTGPTGCGKTTTLYAILKIVNKPEINIATIEDPVEYDIQGISQIQVNTKTNLSFAQGLRSIVRQDPDVIMVGEIRDEETAAIAVNSAMTGHMVLSTVHANDAATTLPRLLDMGIEPFLIASTVKLIIAQRLVRRICAKCRSSYIISEEESRLIESSPNLKRVLAEIGEDNSAKLRLYRGNGCNVCSQTGYAGRIGIFEVLAVDDTIRKLILDRSSSETIGKAAVAAGMDTLLKDGLDKTFNGLTTLSEIIRVTESG